MSYDRVDDEGLHLTLGKPARGGWPRALEAGEAESADGKTRSMVLRVDSVVVCAGQEPLRDLLPELKVRAPLGHSG